MDNFMAWINEINFDNLIVDINQKWHMENPDYGNPKPVEAQDIRIIYEQEFENSQYDLQEFINITEFTADEFSILCGQAWEFVGYR